MDDLEMTKLCAEAMGLEVSQLLNTGICIFANEDKSGGPVFYRPLKNDAQAMALVKKCGLEIWMRPRPNCWNVAPFDYDSEIRAESDNLNHAIVECVAKMQKQKAPAPDRLGAPAAHPR